MTVNSGSGVRLRIITLMAVLSAGTLILIGQLFRWQVLEHQTFLALAEKNIRPKMSSDRTGVRFMTETASCWPPTPSNTRYPRRRL